MGNDSIEISYLDSISTSKDVSTSKIIKNQRSTETNSMSTQRYTNRKEYLMNSKRFTEANESIGQMHSGVNSVDSEDHFDQGLNDPVANATMTIPDEVFKPGDWRK